MIVVLSDEQLERIEDALRTAETFIPTDHPDGSRIIGEISDALAVVEAARALLAA